MPAITDKIKFKLKEEKPCELTFSVQIPQEVVLSKQQEVERELQKVAQLPGFRAGKAPIDLIRKNYSGRLQSETMEQLLKDAVPHILKEKSVYPIATPVVESLEYNGKSALSFHLKVERNPEFKVRNYTRLPIEKKTKKIGDADVEKELDQLAERNAQLVPSAAERLAANHLAVIDYVGSADGGASPDLKAENQLIDLSQPQSVAGFSEGILGLARGETKEITVDFPKEHPRPELAGKPVRFQVTLREIKEKSVPPAGDDLAKDVGFASLEELKTRIRESLERMAEQAQKSDLDNQIFEHLLKENPIPVPASLVTLQLESTLNQMKEQSRRQGVPEEEWKKNEPALTEKYRPQAERRVRLSYLLHGIAKQEKLEATPEEFQAEVDKAKSGHPEKAQEIEAYFLEHRTAIASQLSEEKVMQFILDNAKVKEAAAA